MKSHFFAYISKIRWLQRWGLKRNTVAENVMEHSWEVSVISHALALIRNCYFDGNLDVNAIVVAALYHDCSEILTGDLPSPIKYHSPEITKAYKSIEKQAEYELLNLLPEKLQQDYRPFMIEEELPKEHKAIIKAADIISAYLKCKMELAAGNQEFSIAEKDIEEKLKAINLPEVQYFLDTFTSSYELTLDELFKKNITISLKSDKK
ncbi:MAG: 5'-deoxynucleotidase [Methylococcaceae bacterium]